MKKICISILRTIRGEFKYILIPVIIVAAVTIIFRMFFVISYVPTESMEPLIPSSTYVLSKKNIGEINRGDIIVFYSEEEDKLLVKRVIGVGGDVISIIGDSITLNNEPLNESYTVGKTEMAGVNRFTVPDNEYFVMGDNRENSLDSRSFQNTYISQSSIKGKVIYSLSFGDDWNFKKI